MKQMNECLAVIYPVRVTLAGWRPSFGVGCELEVAVQHLEGVEGCDRKGEDADYALWMLCHYKLMRSEETKKKPRHQDRCRGSEVGRGGDLSAADWGHVEMAVRGINLLAIERRRVNGNEVRP